uniref:Uncharacterized protein n=1 Tax=Streptomyces sp. NBC_00093 TaxID=2975649 RepID=A0AAU2AHE4_9ACTN
MVTADAGSTGGGTPAEHDVEGVVHAVVVADGIGRGRITGIEITALGPECPTRSMGCISTPVPSSSVAARTVIHPRRVPVEFLIALDRLSADGPS